MPTTAKKTKKATADVLVTIAQFDDVDPFEIIRDGKITEFDPIGAEYAPRASTPLRDATAKFIGHLDKASAANADGVTIGLLLDRSGSMGHLRQSVINGVNEFVKGMADTEVDDDARGKVLAVVFTDGNENASREVDAPTLAEITREREARGWTFIYMGANQDAWNVGRGMGLSGGATGQSVNFVSTPGGTSSAFASVTSDAVGYLSENATYAAKRSGGSSLRSLTETGEELLENTAAPSVPSVPLPAVPEVPSPYDVTEALKQAKDKS